MNNLLKPVLFVLTSHSRKGETGEATGFYLSEVTHPLAELERAGMSVEFASIAGGEAPVDGVELNDPVNARYWQDETFRSVIRTTQRLNDVDASRYSAIYFAGGHGTMWDFPDSPAVARVTREIYEAGGLVAAVCHGPSALVNVTLSDGRYLVQGKRISACTNKEELAAGMADVVPFSLADVLIQRGAEHKHVDNWQSQVVTDGRLITGQNPQSASGVGAALRQALLASVLSAHASGEQPVVVTLNLTAKDPAAFKAHLQSVIPQTRLADGNQFSWSLENPENAAEFTLIQGWDSLAHQQSYLAWREARGDLAAFVGQLTIPPQVEVKALFDR